MSAYLSHYLETKKKRKPGEKLPSLQEIKMDYVRYLLEITDNDLEETAKILDVPPNSIKPAAKK
jgi:hypothetical protein